MLRIQKSTPDKFKIILCSKWFWILVCKLYFGYEEEISQLWSWELVLKARLVPSEALEALMTASSGHCQDWGSWCKLCLVCHTKTRWTKQYYGCPTRQHTHIFTLCEELSKCSFCLPSVPPSPPTLTNLDKYPGGGGGHSKERERDTGTVGSREKKAVDAVFLQRGPMVLTDLTIP